MVLKTRLKNDCTFFTFLGKVFFAVFLFLVFEARCQKVDPNLHKNEKVKSDSAKTKEAAILYVAPNTIICDAELVLLSQKIVYLQTKKVNKKNKTLNDESHKKREPKISHNPVKSRKIIYKLHFSEADDINALLAADFHKNYINIHTPDDYSVKKIIRNEYHFSFAGAEAYSTQYSFYKTGKNGQRVITLFMTRAPPFVPCKANKYYGKEV